LSTLPLRAHFGADYVAARSQPALLQPFSSAAHLGRQGGFYVFPSPSSPTRSWNEGLKPTRAQHVRVVPLRYRQRGRSFQPASPLATCKGAAEHRHQHLCLCMCVSPLPVSEVAATSAAVSRPTANSPFALATCRAQEEGATAIHPAQRHLCSSSVSASSSHRRFSTAY
jgi:hypothetical protein